MARETCRIDHSFGTLAVWAYAGMRHFMAFDYEHQQAWGIWRALNELKHEQEHKRCAGTYDTLKVRIAFV
jgi:hypothetical protein